jgi:hypothetical protein
VWVNVGWLKTSCELHGNRMGGDEVRRRQRVQEPGAARPEEDRADDRHADRRGNGADQPAAAS